MAKREDKARVQVGRPSEVVDEETFSPLVDVYETEDGATMLLAEVPGAKAETLDIRVDKGVLTIAADGALPDVSEEYVRTYSGFTGGKYFRAFALSDEIDRERIEASLEEGLLKLRLPKAAAAATRKIEVKEI
ncbi:MAG TPA: Hsp20/alpha crystallin family protein [Thermoguttaceae bacterium]|nr:Hsp20/alpha crystallin family protein [Thermoguttaceae bacterium]